MKPPAAGVRTMHGRTAISFGGGAAGPDGAALTSPGVYILSQRDRHVRIVLVAGDNVDDLAVADAVFPHELGDELGRSIRRASDRAKAGAMGMQAVGIPAWGASSAPKPNGAAAPAVAVSATASTEPPPGPPPWLWLLPDHRGLFDGATVVFDETKGRELAARGGVDLVGPFVDATLIPTSAPVPLASTPYLAHQQEAAAVVEAARAFAEWEATGGEPGAEEDAERRARLVQAVISAVGAFNRATMTMRGAGEGVSDG